MFSLSAERLLDLGHGERPMSRDLWQATVPINKALAKVRRGHRHGRSGLLKIPV